MVTNVYTGKNEAAKPARSTSTAIKLDSNSLVNLVGILVVAGIAGYAIINKDELVGGLSSILAPGNLIPDETATAPPDLTQMPAAPTQPGMTDPGIGTPSTVGMSQQPPFVPGVPSQGQNANCWPCPPGQVCPQVCYPLSGPPPPWVQQPPAYAGQVPIPGLPMSTYTPFTPTPGYPVQQNVFPPSPYPQASAWYQYQTGPYQQSLYQPPTGQFYPQYTAMASYIMDDEGRVSRQ